MSKESAPLGDVIWSEPSFDVLKFDLSEENLGPPVAFASGIKKLLYLISWDPLPSSALVVDNNDRVCLLLSVEEEGSQYTTYYTVARYLKLAPDCLNL